MSKARNTRRLLMQKMAEVAKMTDQVLLEGEVKLLDGQARAMALAQIQEMKPQPHLDAYERRLFKQEVMRTYRRSLEVSYITEPLRPKFNTKGTETCRASGKS